MKNKFLLILLSSLLVTGCGSNTSSEQTIAPTEVPTENPTEAPTEAPTETPTEAPTETPTESPTEAPTEDPTEQPTEAPTEIPERYVASFSHVFNKDDFPIKNGDYTTINGVTFGYTAVTYMNNNAKGVQIGSSNNPQKNPFTLSTSFPDGVMLTSFSVELSVAKSGNSNITVKSGNLYNFTSTVKNYDIEAYSQTNLSEPANNFEISIQATAKAFYLYSLSFTLDVPGDVELNIHGDNDEVKPVVPGVDGVINTTYTPITKEEYYKDVDLTKTGLELKQELNAKISIMDMLSYDDARYSLVYTDENPAKPGYIYGMYDGDDILAKWDGGGIWNREHVWPCAKMRLTSDTDFRPESGSKNHATDLHNLRGACGIVNGFHSDKYYGMENTSDAMFPNVIDGLTGKHNYTGDFRGDVARILFYMATRYDGLKIVEDMTNVDFKSIGILSCLVEWNTEDPVDSFEIQRNNRIYEYQGNRNPFIDYPNLVDSLKDVVSA